MKYGSDEHFQHIGATSDAINRAIQKYLVGSSGHFVKGVIVDHLLNHDKVNVEPARARWLNVGFMLFGGCLVILGITFSNMFFR